MVIRLAPAKVDEYRRLHADVWPGVIERLRRSNVRNYSIFLREPEHLLFGTWEYHGSDFNADMKAIAADPVTQEWWRLTDPCQVPLESRAAGEHWAPMAEVFHME
jgi:L-rhamnose mutarotase